MLQYLHLCHLCTAHLIVAIITHMLSLITIISIISLTLLIVTLFLILKVRKNVAQIYADQDLMATEIEQKLENLNQPYSQQYSEIMTGVLEYKEKIKTEFEPNDNDELYEAAKQAVVEAGKASTSYIQRKLGVGYSRAAHLIDMLEENEVIGPADGSSPRLVLLEEVEE